MPRPRQTRAILLLGTWFSIASPGATVIAEDWPGWRGPSGTGVSSDARVPMAWDETRNVRWRTPLPDRGNSTPVVFGDRVFITQAIEKEGRRTVMCFARGDGKRLWQSGVTATEREPTNGQNPYCSASPATDGRRVVAYFGSAGLFCYDAASGMEFWRRELGQVDSWQGSGSSPVIHGNLCILNAGPGTNAALVACDLDTGEVVWKVKPPRAEGGGARKPGEALPPALREPVKPPPVGNFDNAMQAADPRGAGGYLGSWSTPVVVRVGNRDELIVVHPLQVTAYDPATGRELWTVKGMPEQAFASPAVHGDVLIVMGRPHDGGGTRATAIRLAENAAGDVSKPNVLWQTHFPKECVGSPIIAARPGSTKSGGHAYLVTTFGSVVCLDLATGNKVREHRLDGTGSRGGSWSSLVLAGDKLLVPNQSGEVFVLTATPALDEVTINNAGDEITCGPSLALSDGQVFLRTYKALWCFEHAAR